jgi:hypothetical protein
MIKMSDHTFPLLLPGVAHEISPKRDWSQDMKNLDVRSLYNAWYFCTTTLYGVLYQGLFSLWILQCNYADRQHLLF